VDERGARYSWRQQDDAAAEACKAALASQPESTAMWVNLGSALRNKQDLVRQQLAEMN
jgi:hypothetical protein